MLVRKLRALVDFRVSQPNSHQVNYKCKREGTKRKGKGSKGHIIIFQDLKSLNFLK